MECLGDDSLPSRGSPKTRYLPSRGRVQWANWRWTQYRGNVEEAQGEKDVGNEVALEKDLIVVDDDDHCRPLSICIFFFL